MDLFLFEIIHDCTVIVCRRDRYDIDTSITPLSQYLLRKIYYLPLIR